MANSEYRINRSHEFCVEVILQINLFQYRTLLLYYSNKIKNIAVYSLSDIFCVSFLHIIQLCPCNTSGS